MNLADAIRKAVLHPVESESSSDFATQIAAPVEPQPVFSSYPYEENPLPEPVQPVAEEVFEDLPMNPTPNEPSAEATAGAAVRLELFLTPEQLSNLFRAVAANQHSMLTLREAASYLRVSQSSLETMAHEGELPGFLIDGKWRFSKNAIDEWLVSQQQLRKESA